MMTEWIYPFYQGQAKEENFDRNILGGKGANLAQMSSLGFPVPPGFTITTKACQSYLAKGMVLPEGLLDHVRTGLKDLGDRLNRRFGDKNAPLLVSVRSGASVSMPGMMDTILNLGLNDETVRALGQESGDERFAWDCYRRFIQMYSDVVLGIEHHLFEEELNIIKAQENCREDSQLSLSALRALVDRYKSLVQDMGEAFPQDPFLQLRKGIEAVFTSWMSERAKIYRQLNQLSDDGGTAVNIQAMVFGNRGERCATGVAFTRDPSIGVNVMYGEYLINAQGEDVVAGIRTPLAITTTKTEEQDDTLANNFPQAYAQLVDVCRRLEQHFGDMQDIEFTIENDTLYLLQTRSGKRTAQAALKIAVDMVEEGMIEKEEALLRLDPQSLDQLLHPMLDPDAERTLLTCGLPASPGAASGILAFTASEAERLAKDGKEVLLLRTETSPEDIMGMHASRGILTSRGGMTSHAAVVARSMGRVCITGAHECHIDSEKRQVTIAGKTYSQEDKLTIDGNDGSVYLGRVPVLPPVLTQDFTTVMTWADQVRSLKVRCNADTPEDAKVALSFGAEGVGLCRTEHMFFHADRIKSMRHMILAEDDKERQAALSSLKDFQVKDFRDIFKVMSGRPITVRLLDPPLHEFLPEGDDDCEIIAKELDMRSDLVIHRVRMLKETNPMIGHRGCRLLISYPQIIEMQVQALFQAVHEVKASGVDVELEIMIPLVGSLEELHLCRSVIEQVEKEMKFQHKYQIGTMIELPRAALCAGALARRADFFSFGTNDLTQTTWGISRDDSASFFPLYERNKIFACDPFVSIDREGVGQLIALAAENGRKSRADLKLGICGEHGGDADSIAFCHGLGLDYVSCSPYRLPLARLAAAQAALRAGAKIKVST